MGEVEKLDRMKHRNRTSACDLGDTADVAGGDEIGRGLRDIRDLAVAQPHRNLRLQKPTVFLAQERISGFRLGIP
jgi:hypothetical protein